MQHPVNAFSIKKLWTYHSNDNVDQPIILDWYLCENKSTTELTICSVIINIAKQTYPLSNYNASITSV